jgi:hypothetical protein
LLFVAACCAAIGCTHYDVGSVALTKVPRKTYETFAWLSYETPAETGDNADLRTWLDAHVRTQISAEMTRRGYRPDDEMPDLLLDYHTSAAGEANLEADAPLAGYVTYERGSIVAPPMVGREFAEGTLVIDVADAESRQLLWRGWTTAALDYLSEEDRTEPRVTAMVKRTMKGFPKQR